MIKGINKNAVIVKGKRNEIFEEAIFIVRPEVSKKSVTKEELCKNIELFIKDNTRKI